VIAKILVGEDLMIVGDMNAHNRSWCKCRIINNSGASLENCLINNSICLVTPSGLPTRQNPQTGETKTFDLVLCSPRIYTKLNIVCDAGSELSSDHYPILCTLDEEVPPRGGTKKRFKIKNVNWPLLTWTFEEFDVNSLTDEEVEFSRKIELFQDIIMKIAKNIVPYRGVSAQKGSTWWNKECSEAKRDFMKRRRIYNSEWSLHNHIEIKTEHMPSSGKQCWKLRKKHGVVS
jgi:hypothetical protein